MGKAKKEAAKKKAENGVKRFMTSADEQKRIRRIMSTIGFFNTAIEGLNYSLEVEQRRIEARINIGKAKEGYSMQTMIDPVSLELFVREVKNPEPESQKKGKEKEAKK